MKKGDPSTTWGEARQGSRCLCQSVTLTNIILWKRVREGRRDANSISYWPDLRGRQRVQGERQIGTRVAACTTRHPRFMKPTTTRHIVLLRKGTSKGKSYLLVFRINAIKTRSFTKSTTKSGKPRIRIGVEKGVVVKLSKRTHEVNLKRGKLLSQLQKSEPSQIIFSCFSQSCHSGVSCGRTVRTLERLPFPTQSGFRTEWTVGKEATVLPESKCSLSKLSESSLWDEGRQIGKFKWNSVEQR